MTETKFRLLPEWAPQSAVLLSWPHKDTDWQPMLGYIAPSYAEYAAALAKVAKVLIVCPDRAEVEKLLHPRLTPDQYQIIEMPTNDTWPRDSGPITVTDGQNWRLLDYKFNGWGLKFPACFDNLITRHLIENGVFPAEMEYVNRLGFVLEGGSIDIDEDGTLLTTSECLLSPNRNGDLTEEQIEQRLIEDLGATKVIWLRHGALIGDDTDSHVDTLARFLPGNKIAYTACCHPTDPQYDGLKAMEQELQHVTNTAGEPYELIPLYIPTEINDFYGERIPATYANFLILNGTIFVPTYGAANFDQLAIDTLSEALPGWNIVPLPCRYLLHQHGSIHCATMQLPRVMSFEL